MSNQITTLHSERYGELQLTDSQIIRFERGFVGLRDYREYGLIPLEDTPFYILHALEGQLSFILIPADEAIDGYGFNIDEETIALLDIRNAEDVSVFLIVNIVDDALHVNLKAPVLIAPAQRNGCQFVIHDIDYPIRHPLTGKEGA